MLRRCRLLLVLLALVALVAVACGDDDDGASKTTAASGDALSGDLQVLAASSLTEAFTDLGKAFEADHPNVKVTFSFAASSALAEQVNQGAPADVVATADESSMEK